MTLVLLSGGQDSTTCLFWALAHPGRVEALSVDYGQAHSRELVHAKRITDLARVPHHVIKVDLSGSIQSSLTTGSETTHGALPKSFVPGRNLWFLSLAAGVAMSRGLHTVTIGTNEVDFSGYPDCRPNTLAALETAIGLGLGQPMPIQAPLSGLSKKGIVEMAHSLGPLCWAALGLSWSCYLGGEYPCGTCPACAIRRKGFEEANLLDPYPHRG